MRWLGYRDPQDSYSHILSNGLLRLGLTGSGYGFIQNDRHLCVEISRVGFSEYCVCNLELSQRKLAVSVCLGQSKIEARRIDQGRNRLTANRLGD